MAAIFREIPRQSPSPSPSKLVDFDLTIVSGKHLKNVNWQHGDLVPYAVAWIDPDHKLPTAVDPNGGTKPVWNERLSFSFPFANLERSCLTIDVLHASDLSSPLSKTLVGSARLSLSDAATGIDSSPLRLSLNLRRPSGRPQGKIKVAVAVKERALPSAPQASYFPPPSLSRDLRSFSSYQFVDPSYPRPPNHYPAPYPLPSHFPPPPPPPQSVATDYYNRPGYLSGPSAPFDSLPASSSLYTADYGKGKPLNAGFGPREATGSVTGALSALTLEEVGKYEEEKEAPEGAERKDMSIREKERFSDYRDHY